MRAPSHSSTRQVAQLPGFGGAAVPGSGAWRPPRRSGQPGPPAARRAHLLGPRPPASSPSMSIATSASTYATRVGISAPSMTPPSSRMRSRTASMSPRRARSWSAPASSSVSPGRAGVLGCVPQHVTRQRVLTALGQRPRSGALHVGIHEPDRGRRLGIQVGERHVGAFEVTDERDRVGEAAVAPAAPGWATSPYTTAASRNHLAACRTRPRNRTDAPERSRTRPGRRPAGGRSRPRTRAARCRQPRRGDRPR